MQTVATFPNPRWIIWMFYRRIRYFPVAGGFRSRFRYSNYGYVLAAAIVEKIRKISWEDDIERTIFGPLGKAQSCLSGNVFLILFWLIIIIIHGPTM